MGDYAIRMQFDIDADHETVMQALTTSDGVEGWWSRPVDGDPGKDGGEFRISFPDVPQPFEFAVERGEVLGFLGPNGAGKTTSFYMVVGLVSPDQGEIEIDDRSIGSLPMFQRARVGLSYLPQEPSIFRKLTVRENILVALEAQGSSAAERGERLEKLLDEFHIQHIRENYGYSLSGGERRRVEIARARLASCLGS